VRPAARDPRSRTWGALPRTWMRFDPRTKILRTAATEARSSVRLLTDPIERTSPALHRPVLDRGETGSGATTSTPDESGRKGAEHRRVRRQSLHGRVEDFVKVPSRCRRRGTTRSATALANCRDLGGGRRPHVAVAVATARRREVVASGLARAAGCQHAIAELGIARWRRPTAWSCSRAPDSLIDHVARCPRLAASGPRRPVASPWRQVPYQSLLQVPEIGIDDLGLTAKPPLRLAPSSAARTLASSNTR